MAAALKLHKYRLRARTLNATNYAVFTATALLVLICAHAKSAQSGGDNLLSRVAAESVAPKANASALSAVPTEPAETQQVQQGEAPYHHHHPHEHHHEPTGKHHGHHHSQQMLTPSGVSSLGSKRPYHSKFTIDELLSTKYETKVSNDIYMDPCKAGGFMGDIALSDADYETPLVAHTVLWEPQSDEATPLSAKTVLPAALAATKFNASFQQELEILKQEVYHEGLQVEEEGLTHIIRKKTKLPSSSSSSSERHRNDPVLSANELVKPTGYYPYNSDNLLKNLKNEVITPLQRRRSEGASDYIEAKKPPSSVMGETLTAAGNSPIAAVPQKGSDGAGGGGIDALGSKIVSLDGRKVNLEAMVASTEKANKSTSGWSNRNVDQRKIQSNTKDIEDDSGNNFVAERRVIILPTSLPTQRSTLPNVYSNAGGNGMKLDDVDFLHAEGVVRRRHRRGRKHRRSSEARSDYAARLERLKEELSRPVRTMRDYRGALHQQRQQQRYHRQSVKTGTAQLNHDHSHKPHDDNAIADVDVDVDADPDTATAEVGSAAHQRPRALPHAAHTMIVESFNYSSPANSGERDAIAVVTTSKKDIDVDSDGRTAATVALETDILAPNSEKTRHRHRQTRAVTAKRERVWDYGVIPYEIDGNFSGLHKALFKQAMRHWENSTCIKFVERDPEIHPNYIVFTVRSCGCCSFVGKRGNGPQAISIGRNCDKFGIVVHELGHVVGFWHEHTRPDREKHVVIEHNNIMKGQDYNFNKLTPDEVDSLGMAYDYDSIMHYARNTFSKGTYLDTILPIEVKGKKRPEIGQRLRLSLGDVAQANLLYKCPKCGRTFQENTGIFSSPSYYTAGALTNETEHCEWRITATHGERVVLRLDNLNIFKSNNCQTDYLEVRDGYFFKSPLIGRFCGKVSGETLTTETSRMLLTYVNTHRTEGFRGFKAEYDVICGGELSVDDAEGRLESPNYPLDYLPNKECVWKITVPKGYQVALKFQSFEVENHDSCVYDFVEVRDGPTQEASLIGVFCGYKPPPNMKSSGNAMFVKFISDTSVQKAGFSAIFMKEVDECETQNHGCEHDCINTLGGYECSCHIGYELHSDKKHCEDACGGVIEYPNGTITSPSFPEIYPVLKECIWEIIAPPKHKISLNFTHFDLEGTNNQQSDCGYDSVTIYSKLTENRLKRIGTYCGSSTPPTATSESNALRVEFHSDKSIQRSGFAAVFFTDIDECSINNGGCQHECRNTIGSYMCSCHNGYSLHENGHDCKEGECKHEISGHFGTIYSPNYPDNYPPNADCVWHFSTTPGHRIKLIFNEFRVESHQECAYDNVAIYDGESESSSILGRFCGDKIPYPISSSTNQLYMVLKTDKNKQMNGFTAMHSTSCGGYLRASRHIQQFYSHARFGNNNYNENMDCEWTIQAPPSANVQLIFLTFDIEISENCTYDYVQVYSGMEDTSGPLYGQYCGNTLPQDIISMTDSLLVRFKTDSSITTKGFSASYVAVDPFENSDEENNSYSSEMVTPFPGSLKSIYKEDETQESDDYSDFSENQLLVNSPYMARSRYQNRL